MTDRDRLIELLEQAKTKAQDTIGSMNNGFGAWYADYLLEHGVIIPPCKVDDTMYCDGKFFADHCKGQIMSFPVDIVRTEVCSTHRCEIDMMFDFKRLEERLSLYEDKP